MHRPPSRSRAAFTLIELLKIRLIGGTSDCSCITTANMPLTIDPGETVTVPVRLKVLGSASGAFTRHVDLWTDCDRRRTVGLTIGCRVE